MAKSTNMKGRFAGVKKGHFKYVRNCNMTVGAAVTGGLAGWFIHK